MNNKALNEFDEASTTFNATVPGLLFTFYGKCMEQGFNPPEAFTLTQGLLANYMVLICNRPPRKEDGQD